MRMWEVNCQYLCNQHLLGEHLEMHMFAGAIRKGTSIKGYLQKGLVNPRMITKRHNELAKEMRNRGMKHQSPLKLSRKNLPEGSVDKQVSLMTLIERCSNCKKRINKEE